MGPIMLHAVTSYQVPGAIEAHTEQKTAGRNLAFSGRYRVQQEQYQKQQKSYLPTIKTNAARYSTEINSNQPHINRALTRQQQKKKMAPQMCPSLSPRLSGIVQADSALKIAVESNQSSLSAKLVNPTLHKISKKKNNGVGFLRAPYIPKKARSKAKKKKKM